MARTEEATSATARAAAVWAAARVVLSVAEVMVLVGMAAMRVAAVAAFKRCTLSADAPIDAPPQRERKRSLSTPPPRDDGDGRETTLLWHSADCQPWRWRGRKDAEQVAQKELPPPRSQPWARARAMRDVIRYECRSGKPGDEHVPAATTQTTETACVACMYTWPRPRASRGSPSPPAHRMTPPKGSVFEAR